MSRLEILVDFLTQQEWDRLQAEIRKKAEEETLPLCPDCGFRGEPVYQNFCPKCGTQMQTGQVFVDPEFDKHLERLGFKKEDLEQP